MRSRKSSLRDHLTGQSQKSHRKNALHWKQRFCDVTTLEYAKKVESLGADAVIAVSSGAGGHAGGLSPLVLIPYLKRNISLPIIAAGGIACGEQMAAALVLGAAGVQLGTRFIASEEAKVSIDYKMQFSKPHPKTSS